MPSNGPYADYDRVLAFLVNRASHALRRSLADRFREAGYGLTPEDFAVVRRIASRGPVSQSELVRSTFKDAPAVSRTIRTLEEQGLVEVSPSAEDRRVRLVRLSKRGRQVDRQLVRIAEANVRRAEGSIPEKDLEITRDVLREIWSNLEQGEAT